MKRITFFVLLVVCAVVAAHSQDSGRQAPGDRQGVILPPSSASEKITVRGNLAISQGTIAVKSGDTTYLVPEVIKYSCFIDALKEGAR